MFIKWGGWLFFIWCPLAKMVVAASTCQGGVSTGNVGFSQLICVQVQVGMPRYILWEAKGSFTLSDVTLWIMCTSQSCKAQKWVSGGISEVFDGLGHLWHDSCLSLEHIEPVVPCGKGWMPSGLCVTIINIKVPIPSLGKSQLCKGGHLQNKKHCLPSRICSLTFSLIWLKTYLIGR